MTFVEIEKMLIGLGYKTKAVTRYRIAVVTDKRSDALNSILKVFKGSRLSKNRKDLSLSSLGVIYVGNTQIIAKPETKNVLKAEQEATEALIKIIRQAVEQEGKPIDILIGKYMIKSVVSAGSDQIQRSPKADIALIDDMNKEVGFISHKKEGDAKAFQQYSGISKDAGSSIYRDPLVVSFVKDVYQYTKNKTDNAIISGTSFWRHIPETSGRSLVGRSVYGPEWKQGTPNTFNRDSVHCIAQGKPILTRSANGNYILTFSEMMRTADDINWAFKGSYKAILAATHRPGRRIENDGIIILDMRAGIYPYDFVSGRKSVEL